MGKRGEKIGKMDEKVEEMFGGFGDFSYLCSVKGKDKGGRLSGTERILAERYAG